MEQNIGSLESTTTRMIKGKKLIVESLFANDKGETFGSLLMRLMKDDIVKSQSHKSQA